MKKIFLSISIVTLFFACKGTKETASTTPPAPLDCTSKVITYETDIKPIMEASCTRCHNTNNKAGYNFKTIESVKKAGADGHLLGTIKHLKGYSNMPAFSKQLDKADIDKIECWVNNGMKD